ncbi:MAG: hypothetical protein LBT50_06130 [Prevotellaceae bacterium]|jgi:hypothetical protein|nr:hypothetical protein [Prevotellaceae bacterium]
MKKSILVISVLVLVFACAPVQKQADEAQVSKLQKLLDTPGKSLQQEVYLVDKLPATNYTIRVEAIVVNDVITNEKATAVKLSTYSTVGSALTTHTGLLDEDEIEPVIKLLEHLRDTTLKSKPDTDSNIRFHSRSGIHIGANYDARLSSWLIYFNTKGEEQTARSVLRENNKIDEAISVFRDALETFKTAI